MFLGRQKVNFLAFDQNTGTLPTAGMLGVVIYRFHI